MPMSSTTSSRLYNDACSGLACAAPVFQMQQLYRYGEVDDCTRHWRQFYDCLKKRTKFADQVDKRITKMMQGVEPLTTPSAWQLECSLLVVLQLQVVESRPAEPLWQLRTPEEATSFWQVAARRRSLWDCMHHLSKHKTSSAASCSTRSHQRCAMCRSSSGQQQPAAHRQQHRSRMTDLARRKLAGLKS